MNDVVNAVEKAVEQEAPQAPIVEAAIAVGSTIANPTPESIISDVTLAIKLVNEVKAKLANSHPSIMDIFKALL